MSEKNTNRAKPVVPKAGFTKKKRRYEDAAYLIGFIVSKMQSFFKSVI